MRKSKRILALSMATLMLTTSFSMDKAVIAKEAGVAVETVEALIAEAVSTVEETNVLIKGNSVWKYEDSNTDMYGEKFWESDYTEESWKSGVAPLGYPVKDYNDLFGAVSDGTLVNNVSKPNAIITYYFRNTFEVTGLENITKLTATVGIDDGFVMYINGTEVNRSYMDEGEVTHSSEANYVNEPSSAEGTVVLDLSKYIDLLQEGTNVIAVSVHNRDANSSDIYFDMELAATSTVEVEPEVKDENKTPKQVNSHMGTDPSSQINVTYTTIDEEETKIVYNKVGDDTKYEITATPTQGASDKYFHSIKVEGLESNTQYEYVVGEGVNSLSGKFMTAPKQGSDESFKFVYVADTQVSNATNAKALGATMHAINQLEDISFVYLAGDITDTSTNETQWELLFNNDGLFENGGQEMFANNTVSVVQGNHDNSTLQRHINAPAEAGNIVYSYDWGPATFIMLNLETARSNASAREEQAEYVRQVAKEAKERGQWTIVGFHKSIYTGASHITDSDVIDARKFWHPIFVELDVDMVLQGHDHVYSRGFVNEEGANANPTIDEDNKVIDPVNAPLYMVGGHAGGLKWYSKKNYTVGANDPLALGYSFLDVNSTDTGSDVKKEQVIVEFEVSDSEFTVNSYMFKYDTTLDEITTEKYLYDTVTVKRSLTEAELIGSDLGVTEIESEVTYDVVINNVVGSNAFKAELNYNEDELEFVKAESLVDETIVEDYQAKDGTIKAIVGTTTAVTAEKQHVVRLTFKLKKELEVDQTTVTLVGASTAAPTEDGESATDQIVVVGNNNQVNTTVHSYKRASDITKDGVITLADLSVALVNYRATDKDNMDINLDGVVDTADYILLIGYIQ